MILNETLNEWSANAGTWAISHLVGTAAALVLVALIWMTIRRRSAAALGCWLFFLVLVKPMVPFEVEVHRSWFPFGAAGEPAAVSEPIAYEGAGAGAVAVPARALAVDVVLPQAAEAMVEPVRLTLASGLMLGWAAIALALLGRLIWVQRKTSRWLRPASREPVIEAEVGELAGQIGMRGKVRVFSNCELDSPMVYGLRRPVLMLPEGFADQLDADQRRWVLLHELAHLKRGDLWVLAFQRLVQIVLFFNPSIWIANRVINRLREYACDDIALLHSKMDRRSCGEGFLRVVERAHGHPVPGAAALALFERRSDSKRRLARILDSRRRLAAKLGLGGVVLLGALGLVLLPGLRAQEATASNTELSESSELPGVAEPVVDDALEVVVANEILNVAIESPTAIKPSIDSKEIVLKIDEDGNIWRILRDGSRAKFSQAALIERLRLAKRKSESPRVVVVEAAGTEKAGDSASSLSAIVGASRNVVTAEEPRAAALAPAPVPFEIIEKVGPREDVIAGELLPAVAAAATEVSDVAGVAQADPVELAVNPSPVLDVAVAELPGVKRHEVYRLAVPAAGIVKAVHAKEGARVAKGEVLLELDTRQAEASLMLAQSKLDAAKSVFETAVAKHKQNKRGLIALSGGEEADESKYAETLANMETSLDKNRAELGIAEAELQLAMIALEQFQLRAPVDGLLQTVVPKPGEYVAPEKPVIELRVAVPGSADPAPVVPGIGRGR